MWALWLPWHPDRRTARADPSSLSFEERSHELSCASTSARASLWHWSMSLCSCACLPWSPGFKYPVFAFLCCLIDQLLTRQIAWLTSWHPLNLRSSLSPRVSVSSTPHPSNDSADCGTVPSWPSLFPSRSHPCHPTDPQLSSFRHRSEKPSFFYFFLRTSQVLVSVVLPVSFSFDSILIFIVTWEPACLLYCSATNATSFHKLTHEL